MGDGVNCPLHGEKLIFCGPRIISKNEEKTGKKIVMAETKSDRKEDQIFRRRYNLPKNRSDQHNIPKQKKNTKKNNNVRKVSKQKANLMMINSLKTVPKSHFTRNGELNISKLNR